MHGQRKVTADIISYQRSLDRLIATGHVTVTDADGTVTQTNYAELTGDLKDGFVRRARVLFVDGAHATARQATRTDGAVTVLQDASYSACRPCRDRSLLWHVRAKEVTHDQKIGRSRTNMPGSICVTFQYCTRLTCHSLTHR